MSKKNQGMQSVESWEWMRKSIKSGEWKLEFGYSSSTIGGVEAVEARSVSAILPYGWLWYRRETGNVIALLECYVPMYLRRCGVMTAIFDHLLEAIPKTRLVVTGRATEFSKDWLEKHGFQFSPEMDRWELVVIPPES